MLSDNTLQGTQDGISVPYNIHLAFIHTHARILNKLRRIKPNEIKYANHLHICSFLNTEVVRHIHIQIREKTIVFFSLERIFK